ncbi:MAG: FecR family protein [Anaerolineales bacterium]
MKRTLVSALLFLSLLLGACTTSSSTSEANSPISSGEPSAANSVITAETTVSAREAVLAEINNNVSIRKTSTDEFVAATNGMSILEGGSVKTSEDAHVRLNLLPDGTIVRVGPNSLFNFTSLKVANGQPQTTIELLVGKIFILLNGGTLDVQTPSGVASVRGSLLSVEFNSTTNRFTASCLEGDCGIRSDDGEEMDLPQGSSSFIEGDEEPTAPFPMDRDEVQDWLDENPELDDYLSELPNPEDFPDLPPDFDGNLDEIPAEYLPDYFLDGTLPPTNDGSFYGTEVPATDAPTINDAPPTDPPVTDSGNGDPLPTP